MVIKLKRVYEPAAKGDGFRVLVDRLWPRGVSKERAQLDAWLKDVAPSDELRRWYHHEEPRWAEFRKRYKAELRANSEPLDDLRALAKKHRTLTLLYGARDNERNEAVVLAELLE